VLLELVGDAAVHRDVTGVVRPAGDLVQQQRVLARDEQLDGHDAGERDASGQIDGELHSRVLDGRGRSEDHLRADPVDLGGAHRRPGAHLA